MVNSNPWRRRRRRRSLHVRRLISVHSFWCPRVHKLKTAILYSLPLSGPCSIRMSVISKYIYISKVSCDEILRCYHIHYSCEQTLFLLLHALDIMTPGSELKVCGTVLFSNCTSLCCREKIILYATLKADQIGSEII